MRFSTRLACPQGAGKPHRNITEPQYPVYRIYRESRINWIVETGLFCMHILEAMRIALQSLWANKLRSLLTLLGVVIGIASVIAVVTFINGINGYVAEKIFNLGADVFIISKQANVITNVDQFLEAQKRKNLTLEDFEAVRENCKSCKTVGASVRTDRTTV